MGGGDCAQDRLIVFYQMGVKHGEKQGGVSKELKEGKLSVALIKKREVN